jgi:hypothetical protein
MENGRRTKHNTSPGIKAEAGRVISTSSPLTLLGQGLTSEGISRPMSLGNCTSLGHLARNFLLATCGVLDGHVGQHGFGLIVES